MKRKLNAHVFAGVCTCGREVKIICGMSNQYVCECGKKYIIWFNAKDEKYELIIK